MLYDIKSKKSTKIELPYDYVPGMNVADDIKQKGIWAPMETYILDTVLTAYNPFNASNEYLVIDVGSNLGYFSLISASHGYKTHAIEPNDVHEPYVKQSIKVNEFDNLITLHSFFASDNDHENAVFDGWSGNLDILDHSQKFTKVKTQKLDSHFKSALFLKIDVEGCEDKVLNGAKNLLGVNTKYIITELTYCINNQFSDSQFGILKTLFDNDYKVYEINNGNNTLKPFTCLETIKKTFNKNIVWCNDRNIKHCGLNIIAIHSSALVQDF